MLTRFGHALRNHDCTVRHATSLLKFVVFLPLRGVMLYAMMRSDFPFLRKARFLLSSSRNIANHPVGAKFNESLTMKKSLLVLAVAATFAAGFARADEVAPAEVKPDNEVAFNVGVTTDYRYRGISQTDLSPALQGGADYTNNPTGLYLGTWLSTIHWTHDAGGSGHTEVDLYGGKRGEIVPDVTYDVGVLSYLYPLNDLGPKQGLVNANTTEWYAQLGYQVVTLKYSQSISNLFANPNSKQSGYVDLSSAFDIVEGYNLGLHVGHQSVKNNGALSYTDWKIGVTKEIGGVAFTAAFVGTNANRLMYQTPEHQYTGKNSFVLSALKTF